MDEELFFHIRRSDFLHDVVSIGRSLLETRPSRSSHSINLRNRRAKKKGRTKRIDRHENKIFYTAALPRIIYDSLCFTEWRIGVERTSLANLKPFLNNHSILDTRSLIPESKKENKGRVFRIKNLATICRMSSNIGSFSLRYFDLEVSTRWRALDEIYKIQLFLHRSDLKNSTTLVQFVFASPKMI